MKNHIIFKFIAVILCAAALMGAIGGAAGVFALTQGDLYNKTVDQVREARIQEYGKNFAHEVARTYSSEVLGGCNNTMVTDTYGSYWQYGIFNRGAYAYEILDAEGNVLDSYQPELKAGAVEYSFPVTGQYMHLVSSMTASERNARNEAQQAANMATITEGGTQIFDAIPPEGASVSHALFLDVSGNLVFEAYVQDGNSVATFIDPSGIMADAPFYPDTVGSVYYNRDGNVVYMSPTSARFDYDGELTVANVFFRDVNGNTIFEASHAQSVGTIHFNENGALVYISDLALEAAPQEATEPTEETVPETTAETVPEETAAEEAIPVETYWEEQEDGSWVAVPVAPAEAAEYTEDGNSEEAYSEEAEGYTEETEWTESTEEWSEETQAQEWIEETAAEEWSEETTSEEWVEATEAVYYNEEGEAAEAAEAATEPTIMETIPEETIPEETVPEETVPAEPEPILINGKPLAQYDVISTNYYDPELDEIVFAEYVYTPMPEMTVKLYLGANALQDEGYYSLLRVVRSIRSFLLPAAGICLLVLAIMVVYLCTAAGRKPKTEEVHAGGLNRLPLDLYAGLAFGGIALMIGAGMLVIEENLLQYNFMVGCACFAVAAFTGCLLFVGFFFALVAQLKTPGGYWWSNSLCGRCIRLFIRFAVWLEKFLGLTCFPFLGRTIKACWQGGKKFLVSSFRFLDSALTRFGRWTGKKLHRFLSWLPLTWQWLLAGLVIIFFSVLMTQSYNAFLILIGLLIPLGIVLYGSHCFGALFDSTKRMSKGDLDTKVDDKMMVGCFKEFAGDLNDLADVAVVAAQKQLKSERMKTELITNVSHDIKTPLTSIINYVDLLQKPHTAEEQEQYLEVLDRQSQRLKKLIDDLMDMSKASTGNMAVEIFRVDAVESVNQALGEFADKLDKAQLYPVFRHEEDSVAMMADGRLVWRVMSNLLSNAVKYAMPGTRLYVDLVRLEGKVIISLKNISRDELNVDADELMERFVRGDDSRNTEGSGLGLNIAKSLMELQKGQLQLLVDGDLFKVTLIFPGV